MISYIVICNLENCHCVGVVRGGCLLKDLKYEVSNLRFDETWRTSLARTTSLSRFQIQQLAVDRISEPHRSPVPPLKVSI
jgi:hypothetical protein